MPKDADGIYYIVGGMASVINQYDNTYDFNKQKVLTWDYFGTSKYIKCQCFSYFGDIIAHKENATKSTINKKLTNQGTTFLKEKDSAPLKQRRSDGRDGFRTSSKSSIHDKTGA